VEQLIERLREFWGKLRLTQRIVVVAIPTLLVLGVVIAIVVVIAAPPIRAPLFKNLDTSDAARIVEELKRSGVSYELENEGKDIYVPGEQVYELRLQLAGQGLPQRTVGFELFDEGKLGVTETGMRIDYQRALQGELARTLEALEQVERATVLLNIAPETSFLDTDSRSTASVALQLSGGGRLIGAQVEGIKHLVSHAVSRLAPEDVAVMDGSGNPLNGEEDQQEGALIASMEMTELQRRFRNRVERDLEDKIRQVLEGPYGAGNVSPSVSVEIDFTTLHRESEQYTPVVDDQGIEQHVEEHRERTSGVEEDLGGVPGTTSNIPGYLGIAAGESQATESSKYDLLVEYLVNKEITLEDLPPGSIVKRTAAVAVSTDVWDDTVKAGVEQMVANAIGADVSTNDSVFAQAFEFSDVTATAVASEYLQQARSRNISRIIGWVVALIMVGVMLLLLRSVIAGVLPREELTMATAAVGPPIAPAPVEEEEYPFTRLDQVKDTQQDRMRQEIDRLLDSHPDQVAALVRSWLLEDK